MSQLQQPDNKYVKLRNKMASIAETSTNALMGAKPAARPQGKAPLKEHLDATEAYNREWNKRFLAEVDRLVVAEMYCPECNQLKEGWR